MEFFEKMKDIFTKTYLNIITQQGGIGDVPFPHTGLGLDATPDADHTVISNLLREWNLEKYANNQQILNIIASDYWVRLAYQKYIKSRGSDDLDLKSSVSGIIYKYMDKFKQVGNLNGMVKKIEAIVKWFKSAYYQNDPSFKWKVRQGNDIRPYSIFLEWNDSKRENTYMNGIQLVNGNEINNGTGPISSTIHAFAQKVWRDTKCKNFEVFIRITANRYKEEN